jgi:peptide/nickel transport system ATP-binding protein
MDRCPAQMEICKNESSSHVLTKGHQVTCHLLDKKINLKWDLNSQKKTIPKNYPSSLSLVSVKNLKTYFPVKKGVFLRTVNHIRAVDNINLEIPKGSTLALVGESGCGKTTLGESIIRLNSYAQGEVIFAGQNLMQLTGNQLKYFRKNMQMVFQDPFGSLQPRMNIEGIIAEGLEVHFPELSYELKLEKISRVMKEVGLSDSILERYPHEFSGGQRQRIAIARALILEPEFLVLDEPTSALDVSVQAQILNLLKDLQIKYNLTYLFISHNLSVVRYLANTVAIMYLGRIVEQGPVEELFNTPKHPYTKSLLNAVPDLGERKSFEPLTGDVPSPLKPPAACHFHPRCPIYLKEEQGSSLAKKCVTEYPKVSGEKNNFVRCHAK